MKRYFTSEEELKKTIIEVVNRVYPYYKNPQANISIYEKNKFSIDQDFVLVRIDYDNIGKLEFMDNGIMAQGFNGCLGYCKKGIPTIEDAIEYLLKKYFRIK